MNTPAQIHLSGWHGLSSQEVVVVGETPERYRVKALTRTRLAGRCRWLEPGQTVLVPKYAVTLQLAAEAPPGERN